MFFYGKNFLWVLGLFIGLGLNFLSELYVRFFRNFGVSVLEFRIKDCKCRVYFLNLIYK